MSYQLTSAILGVSLAGTILWLIRRDHLHTRHASWWFVIAFFVVLLGLFPQIVDFVAVKLGVNYPPTLVFVLGMGMILIKVINIDLHQSYLETRVRRLAQRLAILEGEKYQDK